MGSFNRDSLTASQPQQGNPCNCLDVGILKDKKIRSLFSLHYDKKEIKLKYMETRVNEKNTSHQTKEQNKTATVVPVGNEEANLMRNFCQLQQKGC